MLLLKWLICWEKLEVASRKNITQYNQLFDRITFYFLTLYYYSVNSSHIRAVSDLRSISEEILVRGSVTSI